MCKNGTATQEQVETHERIFARAIGIVRQATIQATTLLTHENHEVNPNEVGLCVGRALVDVGIDLTAATVGIPLKDEQAREHLSTIRENTAMQLAILADLYQ